MKKLSFFILLGLTMALLNVNPASAQEADAPAMFLIMEEFVAPSDMAEFWKVQNEAFEIFDEMEFDMTFYGYRTDDNSYYWALPLKNFASIDKMFEKMKNQYNLLNEKGYNPAEKFRDLSSMSQFVVKWNKELSYNPDEMDENAEPDIFHEWTFFYLKSGHEKEAAEAIKKYQEFYDNSEDSYQWDVYDIVLGNHTPCWIFETSAKTELELRTLEEEMSKKYKEDFQKMWQEFVPHIDKMETKKGWYLPNWSR